MEFRVTLKMVACEPMPARSQACIHLWSAVRARGNINLMAGTVLERIRLTLPRFSGHRAEVSFERVPHKNSACGSLKDLSA